jgi:hypothetical protein
VLEVEFGEKLNFFFEWLYGAGLEHLHRDLFVVFGGTEVHTGLSALAQQPLHCTVLDVELVCILHP